MIPVSFSGTFPKPRANEHRFDTTSANLGFKEKMDAAIDKYQERIEALPDDIEFRHTLHWVGDRGYPAIRIYDGNNDIGVVFKQNFLGGAAHPKKMVKAAVKEAERYVRLSEQA